VIGLTSTSEPEASFSFDWDSSVPLKFYTCPTEDVLDSSKWTLYKESKTEFKVNTSDMLSFIVVNPSEVSQKFIYSYVVKTGAKVVTAFLSIILIGSLNL